MFKFSASERDASALRLRNRRFDLSQGLRIELEFRDDAEQVCEYPRLVAVGNYSLQLKVTNNAPDREFKAFLIGPERGTYIQIIVPAKYHWENWHHVACTLEPRNNIMTLQFDRGKVLRHKLPFDLSPAKAELFLGAGGLRSPAPTHRNRPGTPERPFPEKRRPSSTAKPCGSTPWPPFPDGIWPFPE